MKTKLISILISVFFLSNIAFAQQLINSNQYLFNKFSLSPAYAGYNGHTEAFASFRQNWMGVQGAPEYKSFNINSARDETMGFGGSITSDKTGIFTEFSAKVSYAYHLKLNSDLGLHFGINGGLYNNRVDIASIYTSSNNDPVALSYQDYHGTAFDAGLGILLNFKDLNIGISLPRALGTQIAYSSDYNLNYTLARHYQAHLSYFLKVDDWSVEPIAIVQMAENTPLFYEVATVVNYKQTAWLSVQYKKGNTFGVGLGAAMGERFIANYTYEFGNSGMYAISSGSHEISIGFLLRYSEKSVHPPSIFADSKMLRSKELSDKQSKENLSEIKKLQKEIKKLKNQLKDCCTGNSQIKDLQDKIELLEIELKDQSSMKSVEIQYDAPFVLKNITFEMNSDALKSSSFQRLDILVDEMKKNRASTIKIVGYTDNTGGDNYNLLLSKKRSLSVKNYLIDQGIEAHRIVSLGKGKENPIASNSTNEGRAQNRRIEVSFSTNK